MMTQSNPPQRKDPDAVSDFFHLEKLRLGGAIRVLAKGVAWNEITFDSLSDPPASTPLDADEAARWCLLIDNIDDCDSRDTTAVLYLDEENQAKIHAFGGPDHDFGSAVRSIQSRLEQPSAMADRPSVAVDLPPVKVIVAANDNIPIDPWLKRAAPPLPTGLLPSVIEEFATVQGELMGVDAGGMAMAALAVCAAAIPDSITIQPKRHDQHWLESARLWVALIGNPSTKKSPTISTAVAPLRRLDREMFRQYEAAKQEYDALDKAEKAQQSPPANVRLCLGDTTIEAAQEVLKHSRDGVLLIQDELSGWFGAMDKYSGGGRGAAADRGFWLQAFNGGPYSVNRVGRGASMIDNLSVSLLGGIQPEPIRAIARDAHDDGLLQRLFPVVLQTARPGTDKPMPPVVAGYDALVERLHGLRRPMRGSLQEVPVRFDAEAQAVWESVTAENFKLGVAWEEINKKLAAHVGKLDGLFARLCLIWHCVESNGNRPASVISADVASRVARFMREFLFPHAVAFYTDVLGLSDRQDELLATAGWILAHRPQQITARDVRRGDRIMRTMDTKDAETVLEQLDALKWLTPLPAIRRDSRAWIINRAVYVKFDRKAAAEAERREAIRMTIQGNLSG